MKICIYILYEQLKEEFCVEEFFQFKKTLNSFFLLIFIHRITSYRLFDISDQNLKTVKLRMTSNLG